MRITRHLSLWSTLLCLPLITQANTVQRCEDASGNVMFTTLGCPEGHASRSQRAFNAPPGSVQDMTLPFADDKETRRDRSANREIVVVGQRDDGCGNRLSADQRRQAIINQRTPPGMTQRDVESLLGRPDKVTHNNGELRYVYSQKKGRSNTVTFDENGCVKGKR
ncbi:cell envelope protein SmpA [Pseudomonas viridiflava]|uniref:outer membrane protein assembly factor BamE domain-containing protein n=1 Tax=Pseudomonas viridiflava TaxID=33069 RepID=UPI000BBD687B|nr:outer membrane protein assembly factor BamE [Pseudomonas viridiflava]PCK93448.1 cell envelope protein SmpA [Pseudomonas viridiflava]